MKLQKVIVFLITAAMVLGMAPALTITAAAEGTAYTVSNLNNSGSGSLRNAIDSAAPGGTITFQSGLTGTIVLSSQLTISKDLTIQGPGAASLTVSGNNTYRVFAITDGNVTISGLTIANGKAVGTSGGNGATGHGGGGGGGGGAAGGGGGILIKSDNMVIITNVNFTNNTAVGGYGGSGGMGWEPSGSGTGGIGGISDLYDPPFTAAGGYKDASIYPGGDGLHYSGAGGGYGGEQTGNGSLGGWGQNNGGDGGPGGNTGGAVFHSGYAGYGGNGGTGGSGEGGAICQVNGCMYVSNCSFIANQAVGGIGGHAGGSNYTLVGGNNGLYFGGSGGAGGTGKGGAIYIGESLGNYCPINDKLVNLTFSGNSVAGGTGGDVAADGPAFQKGVSGTSLARDVYEKSLNGVSARNITGDNIGMFYPMSAPDAGQSYLYASTYEITAGVTPITITVGLRDGGNLPIFGELVTLDQGGGHSTISPPSAITDADGQAVFTVTNTVAEAVTYRAVAGSVTVNETATIQFKVGGISPSVSTVLAVPTTLPSNGIDSATITVTLVDAYGNPRSDRAVTLSQTGHSVISPASALTDGSGVATFTVIDTIGEQVTYTAKDTWDSVTLNQKAVVTFELPDTAQSTVVATPTSAVADGTDQSTITVTLKLANGSPISGKTVVLNKGSGSSIITPASAITSSSGTAIFTVTDTTAEQVIYTATNTTDNITLPQTAAVTFGQYDWSVRNLTDGSSLGTLRYAVDNAPPGTTITFQSGLAGTINLGGPLVINKNLSIDGTGASITISGQNQCRVFQVDGGTVSIKGITISGGKVAGSNGTDGTTNTIGGGEAKGAGLLIIAGTVEIDSVSFNNNQASGGKGNTPADFAGMTFGGGFGGYGCGGAIYLTNGSLVIKNSLFNGNQAIGGNGGNGTNVISGSSYQSGGQAGGGGGGIGGAIYVEAGSLTVTGSQFMSNRASSGNAGNGGSGGTGQRGGNGGTSSGGAICQYDGSMTITDSQLYNNSTAGGNGGNSRNGYYDGSGGNGDGGAILICNGSLTATDIQFSGNSATGGNKGTGGYNCSNGSTHGLDLCNQSGVIKLTSVTFGPGNNSFYNGIAAVSAESTVTFDPSSVAADGLTAVTITVTLKDIHGGPAGSGKTVTLSQGSGHSNILSTNNGLTDGNGTVIFTVTNTTAETVTYTVRDVPDNITLTQTPTVTFTPSGAQKTTVTVSPASAAADGLTSSIITVTLKDSGGNPLSGKTVTLDQGSGHSHILPVNNGLTGLNGIATFTVTDLQVETVTYTARDTTDNVTITETVTVTFTQPGATQSTVTASPSSVPADGLTASAIQVALIDDNGNPISGKTVALSQGSGHSNITPVNNGLTDVGGTATFTVTNFQAETVTYTASDTTDIVILTQTATVTFQPPDPDKSVVTASVSSVAADGAASSIITVIMKDSDGSPMRGKKVTLDQDGGNSIITPVNNGLTDVNGTAKFIVINITPEKVTYKATDITDNITLIQTVDVTFIASGLTVSTLGDDGNIGSLRFAIENAKPGMIITFKSGLSGTVILKSSLPAINQDLSIDGSAAGVIVSGNNKFRVFEVGSGTVSIKGLTIADGLAAGNNGASGNPAGNGSDSNGGSFLITGGTVSVENVTFHNNHTTGGSGGNYVGYVKGGNGGHSYGGAVCLTNGSLSVVNCTFTVNNAVGGSGGTGCYNPGGTSGNGCGGAIYVDAGILTISDSQFSGNTAAGGCGGLGYLGYGGYGGQGQGGAIYSRTGSLTIINCAFQNNNAAGNSGGNSEGGYIGGNGGNGQGGALYVDSVSLLITDSSFSGDIVTAGGGGSGNLPSRYGSAGSALGISLCNQTGTVTLSGVTLDSGSNAYYSATANCTVTYDSQGGSPVPSSTTTSGTKISAPAAPVQSGFTFRGWYKESSCSSAWDFSADTVTGDITLYANWTVNHTPTAKDTVPVQIMLAGSSTSFTASDITEDQDAGDPLSITGIVIGPYTLIATASLNSGKITIVGAASGMTTITVSVSDGGDTVDVIVPIKVVTKLSTPGTLKWDTITPAKATWGTVTGAASYTVQLYKGSTASGSPITGITDVYYDFTSVIASAGNGDYTFKVTAIGDGANYMSSVLSNESAVYSYTAPVISAIVSPGSASFDKNPANQANVQTTITWGSANNVTDIKAGSASIGAGNYSVSGNTLMIKKAYLATLSTGSLPLTMTFDQGNPATLTIDISDTTPGNSAISPSTASFDKYSGSSNYQDIPVTLALNGNTLTGIYNGSTHLSSNYAYIISDSTHLIILKTYLAAQPAGTTTITFKFSGGADQTLGITVSDTTPGNSASSPSTASFDKYSGSSNYQDIPVTLALNGNTLTGIYNGSTHLSSNYAYIISDSTHLIILKSYLAAQPAGTTTITFKFSGGADQTLGITMSDTTPSIPSGSGGGGNNTSNTPVTVTTSGSTTTATVTVTASAGTNDTAFAIVTQDQLTDAADDALKEAAKQGTKPEIEISIGTKNNATGVSVTIPQAAFDSITDSGVSTLTISSEVVNVSFDETALAAISNAGSGGITISAVTIDQTSLPPEYNQLVGNRPVFDLTVTSGTTTISSFGGGTVTVSIPYEPGPNEDTSKIVVYYISDSGALITVPNCTFDPSTGTVTFKTTHFSTYAVGYNDIRFTDVSGWYRDDVYYLAARDVMKGPGNGLFNPGGSITRAELAQLLYNLSGSPTIVSRTSPFSDVKITDWYFDSVKWAYDTGVITGSDGKFDPNAPVKRQDIAVMLVRYIENFTKHTLPLTGNVSEFHDSTEISQYALNAVTTMQRAGIISGNSDGNFKPHGNATRAEAAKMIATMMMKLSQF